MNKIIQFIQKERLYILILIFVLTFNAVMLFHGESKVKKDKTSTAAAIRAEGKKEFEELFGARRGEVEALLRKNKHLMLLYMLTSLLISALILLGIIIDLILSSKILEGGLDIRTFRISEAQWNIWDVCKVVVLFLFFGYMIIFSEASLSRIFPLLKIDNFRMVINSSILDVLAIVFIIHFTLIQYKLDLKALGLTFKNFLKNVYYGIVGYIALAPVLVLILIITAVVINVTRYVPPRQPIVELFLKEKGPAFLTYTSVFAAIFGPIIEELFFRAFMYNACKKYIGMFWSMVITAAIFAALHTHIVGFAPIMALGILLAYLYEKTGTLVSSITVHVIHNLSMVFLVFLVKQMGMM